MSHSNPAVQLRFIQWVSVKVAAADADAVAELTFTMPG